MSKSEFVPQYKNAKGKVCVKLTDKYGREKEFEVAYLVAQAFVPNPKNYKYIRHKDGNLENNRADNLEWSETEE